MLNYRIKEAELVALSRKLDDDQFEILLDILRYIVDLQDGTSEFSFEQDHVEHAFRSEGKWLYNRTRQLLHANPVRFTISAEDVVQSVFLKAHAMADRLQWSRKDQTRSWLLTTADRVIKQTAISQDTLKRGGGRQSVRLDWLSSSMAGLIRELHDDDPTPSSKVAITEVAQRLESAIDNLPENRREVMRLKFMHDMTEREIAKRIGKSPSAVHSMVFYSLRTLWDGPIRKLQAER